MKECFKNEINQFETLHLRPVGKGDFTGVFGRAFLKAFTPDTVAAAFRVTGIHPFDPSVISETQMKPSVATSTKHSFPLVQTSPVRRVMAVFPSHPPTAFDVSPSTHAAISGNSSPGTPTRQKRAIDPNIDPELYTPSKRMRLLTSNLASSSASFLVSTAPITSANRIAPPVLETVPPLLQPNWSFLQSSPSGYHTNRQLRDENDSLRENLQLAHQLVQAHRLIDEGRNAQLIIQNLMLDKMNQSLRAKEKKNQEGRQGRTKLFPGGYGRHLTNEEFIAEQEADERDKREKLAQKTRRKEDREAKKSRRLEAEAEWKAMLDEHAKEIHEWEVLVEKLKAENVRKKDLPKKPKRPKKPKPVSEEQLAPEQESDGGQHNDSDDTDADWEE